MEEREQLRQWEVAYLWHPETTRKDQLKWGYKMIVEGKGYILKDVDGKEYIDGLGGMECTGVGHGRKEIIDAMAEQGRKLEFEHIFDFFVHEPVIKVAKKLAELTPGDLQHVMFGASGSDSVEIALKIARQYQAMKGFPRRYKVISRWDSFHGVTMGALGANGFTNLREPFEPMAPGFRHIPHPSCCDCPFGKHYPDCDLECAETFEREVILEGPETVAAFIGESISCARGIQPPPKEYWPKIREVCNKYGILLIDDEILIGAGKSGRFYACEHYDYVPDILVTGKGISSGYFPISAVVVKPEIYEVFQDEEAFLHPQTFQGHPIGCAVVLKNLEIIERENLVKNAEIVGKYFTEQLNALASNHPQVISHVTGKGLPHSILLYPKIGSKVVDFEMMVTIRERAYELGLICRFEEKRYIMFCPPLVFDKEAVDQSVKIWDQVFNEIEKEYL